MTDRDLSGRVALVTGGSRGIGRAICRRLARAGAWVAINHSSSDEAAAETLTQIRADGGEGGVYRADVSSFEATDAMFRSVEDERVIGGRFRFSGRYRPQRLRAPPGVVPLLEFPLLSTSPQPESDT